MYVVVGYDEDGYPIWGDDGSEVGSDAGEETSGNLIRLGGPEDIIAQSVGNFTIGSDVIYRLPDGTGMGINTETGEYYPVNAAQLTTMQSGGGSPSADFMSNLRGAGVSLGSGNIFNRIVNQLKGAFTKDGKTDWAALATAAAGIYGMRGGFDVKTGGYNKPVPKMTATREALNIQDPNRRPGQGGLRYFTDVQYTPEGDTAALDAAKAQVAQQATGLRAAYTPTAAPPATSPYAGQFKMPWEKAATTTPPPATQNPASNVANELKPEQRIPTQQQQGVATMADGGIAMLARGGRYLSGPTDGMADKLRTSIDGQQPAALSHGEFVIPADVVSHLGNGNSEAGAKKLYDMMARVRKARTGTKKQGKKINPDKFMPGGLAGYAGGGVVAFQAGGSTATGTNPGTTPGVVSYGTSTSSSLSPWVGEYVTDLLGETRALTKQPYQAYGGPLTAGPSALQQQAFAGASEMAKTGYTPSTFTSGYQAPAAYTTGTFASEFKAPDAYKAGTFTTDFTAPTPYTTGEFSAGLFGTQEAQQYMNPFLQAALDPTLAEMRRQSDIARLADATRLTQAGAFGGSRQAIMESEGRRNLLEKQRQAIGEGYASAYDKAMAQFNADQARQLEVQKAREASRQFGATQGMTAAELQARYGLDAQKAAEASRQFGATQGLTAAELQARYGLDAQKAAEASRQFGATQGMTAAELQARYGMDAQRAAEESRRFSAEFGLRSLADLAKLGAEQRDIEQQGLTAERKAFEEERAYPFSMLDYRRKMLENLPIGTTTSTPNTTGMGELTSRINDLESLYNRLAQLGQAGG